MSYRLYRLSGAAMALAIGMAGQAHALDFTYHCDEVLYSAKTSLHNYQVVLCASGESVNFNYGPIDGASEVDILLNRKYVYYVHEYTPDGAATGKVGLKFDIGRYHYHIHNQLMTFRVGGDERDTETVPLRNPEVPLNVAKLAKYKLVPE